MAFDRHIEADNIDNGFITSIVRAPVVGLAWVLGGLLHDEDKENKRSKRLKPEKENQAEGKGHMNSIQEGLEIRGDSSPAQQPRHIPRYGIGNGGDTATGTKDDNISIAPSLQSPSSSSESSTGPATSTMAGGEETIHLNTNYFQRKKTRKMSWSDESGQDLAVYCGEESSSYSNSSSNHKSSPDRTPQSTAATGVSMGTSKCTTNTGTSTGTGPLPKHEKNRKPMKSAIRNHHNRAFLPPQQQQNKHNVIPSMGGSIVINGTGTVVGAVGKKGGGTKSNTHSHSNGNKNGYISPQWGWYISTTPPTPEYHNNSSGGAPNTKGQVLSHHMNNTHNSHFHNNHNLHPQANTAIGRHWNPTTNTIMEGAVPKPVFRKANPRPGGWPTVPI